MYCDIAKIGVAVNQKSLFRGLQSIMKRSACFDVCGICVRSCVFAVVILGSS